MSNEKDPIGFVNFDGTTGQNNEVEVRIPYKKINDVRRGQYVFLQSEASNNNRIYLARIVRGPFYEPDAVGKDSAFARAAVLEADKVKFRPDYHAICRVEILGEIDDRESLSLVGTSNRPIPQTAALPMSGEEVEKLLGLQGDVYFGELSGYHEVKVHFKQDDKKVFPRNVGIFGTVGSGKTNSSQVFIEEISKAGWAVVVLDVEGEYVQMDQPSKEAETKPRIRKLMERFGIRPEGLKNGLSVYHPIGFECARPEKSKEFGVRFDNVEAYVLGEILDLNAAQMDRFMEAYYELEGEYESKAESKKKARSMIEAVAEDREEEAITGKTLAEFIDKVKEKLIGGKSIGDKSSYAVVLRKLYKLKRSGIFDTKEHLGDYSELLKAGMVSIIDLSNSQNLYVNNIIISTLLNKLFSLKVRDKENKLPPLMIVIEEAHSFISRERAGSMEETLDILRDISRRGRKRWLSLCFISQQPSHLPPEIYELCNTKIVHQITGGKNLDAIKGSAGGVNPALWDEIPIMGQGRCLVISPQFRHPLMTDVRPCSTRRGMTE